MRSLFHLLIIIGVGSLLFAVRVPPPSTAAPTTQTLLIRDVPHVHQKPDFCGEACVASWLQKLGVAADQDDVFDASGLDPSLARGCYTKDLFAAVKRLGFQPGPVWNRVSVAEKDRQINALWSAMIKDLAAGVPSIICMRTSNGPTATEHFRLLLGYDANRDEVIYHEPAERDGAYRRMARAQLIDLWPLKYDPKQWLVVRLALRIDKLPEFRPTARHTAADYAQHIMRLKSRLPNENFTILIEHPFVVVGDEDPASVRRRAEQTIRWATRRLKKEYFSTDPNQILDIWLFKDKTSYETNTLRLFGSKPSTPYGYYSSSEAALVMNIATGGGTLVHEIVHPFIEANFPACPAWLNEGLGSLYEQSSSRGDRIVGLTNWRLAGLQRAINNGTVPSFGTLCGTTTHQFYREDPGTNYAQARYLCYYLQEQGLLKKFYHDFVANQDTDPSGYQTLQRTLQTSDMDQFKQDWEQYVLALRFRR
jgi:hypothetical protein